MASFSIGLAIFLGIIVLCSAYRLEFLETVHRLTILDHFDSALFITPQNDQVALLGFSILGLVLLNRDIRFYLAGIGIFLTLTLGSSIFQLDKLLLTTSLSSLFLTLSLVYFTKFLTLRQLIRKSFLHSYFNIRYLGLGFFAVAITVEATSLILLISGGATLSSNLPFLHISSLELQLFSASGIISPLILVMISVSFLFRKQLSLVLSRKPELLQKSNGPTDLYSDRRMTESKVQKVTNIAVLNTRWSLREGKKIFLKISRRDILLLLFATGVSSIIAFYPQLGIINPNQSGVSTDEKYYIGSLAEMQLRAASGISNVISYAFTSHGGDRPLSLLLLYVVGSIFGSYWSVARFLPVLLSPALVLSIYYLIKLRSSALDAAYTRHRAIIVTMFAALSPQIVAGIYGGFIANWLALISSIWVIAFLIKTWESSSSKQTIQYSVILFGLLTTTMLFHVYMWGHMVISISLFLIVSLIFARKSASELPIKLTVIALAITTSIILDITKSDLLQIPTGFALDENVAGYSFSIDNFGMNWNTISDTLQRYLGGYLLTPILLVLTLVWVVQANHLKTLDRILLSMFFVLSIPLLFGSTTVQARLIYDTPFFIPAGITLHRLFTMKKRWYPLNHVILIFTFLVMANFAIRAMSNLSLVLPEGITLESQFLM